MKLLAAMLLLFATLAPAQPQETPAEILLAHDSGTPAGRWNIDPQSCAVLFHRPPEMRYLTEVSAFLCRPAEARASHLRLWLLDAEFHALAELAYPADAIEPSSELRWVTFAVPRLRVPDVFHVALRAPGLQIGGAAQPQVRHSFLGEPSQGFRPVPDPIDWMLRIRLAPRGLGAATATATAPADNVVYPVDLPPPPASSVYIGGAPISGDFPLDGRRRTLRQALLNSGVTAQPNTRQQVDLFRRESSSPIETRYSFPLRDLLTNPAADLPLLDRDVILVRAPESLAPLPPSIPLPPPPTLSVRLETDGLRVRLPEAGLDALIAPPVVRLGNSPVAGHIGILETRWQSFVFRLDGPRGLLTVTHAEITLLIDRDAGQLRLRQLAPNKRERTAEEIQLPLDAPFPEELDRLFSAQADQ